MTAQPQTEKIDDALPETHEPYTDKYFLRSKQILEEADINPTVGIKEFARGSGPVTGIDEMTDVFEQYAPDLAENGAVWVTEEDRFETKEPLMVVEAPIQDVIDLETMYLGVHSHHLTDAHPDYSVPEPETFGDNVAAATDVYDEAKRADGDTGIPLLYFGARHYHPLQDNELAGAALENGAVQTSTDVGSSNISEQGVGTTPHILTLALASEYGKENATRKTAELFDTYMDDSIPRVTLVDTFNREIDDALAVCESMEERYGDDWEHSFRVDTCGENVAQGADSYDLDDVFADVDLGDYADGSGVRVAGVAALRDTLIEEGYGDNTDIVLSSGMGNPEKAEAFVNAQNAYVEERGYDLFTSVGAGSFADGVHCTADMYEADGEPMYKDGRAVAIDDIETYKEEHMEQVIG